MTQQHNTFSLLHSAINGVCQECGRDYGDDVPDVCSDDCPGEEANAGSAA